MAKEVKKAEIAVKETETIFLTRDMLLSARDTLKIEKVVLTRGHVFVREMTGEEKDIWERSMRKPTPGGNKDGGDFMLNLDDYKAKLAVVTICDESGNLLFDMRDIKKISKVLSAANMEKIANKAQEMNAISEKDKKDLLKNSEADLNDNSNSDSA